MEEETSEERKIEKYESGGNGKMSVIWSIGKKIVISGIVITSAPFVLPPVLLVSTVGFAFAVPFGLVFASYVCTEKIMRKLLPLPPSPSVEWKEDGEEGVVGMEMEEEEFEGDVKKTLEMRIERIEDERNAFCAWDEEDKLGGVVNGLVEEEEKGNEGVLVKVEVDDFHNEEENLVGEVNGFVEDETIEEKDVPVEESSNYYEEEEKLMKGRVGMIVEIRDGGNVYEAMEEEEMKVKDYFDDIEEEEYLVKQDCIVVLPVEEIFKNTEEENIVLGEAEGGEKVTNEDYILEKSKGKEGMPMKGVLYFGEGGNEVNDYIPIQEDRTVEGVVKGVEENGYKENGVVEEKMVPIEVQGMVEGRRDDEKLDDMVEEVKPIVETTQVVEERKVGKAKDVPVEEEKPVIKEKQVRITLNGDNSREIADESGLDLYDEETPTLQQYNYKVDEICENRVAPVIYSYHTSTNIHAGIEPQEVSSEHSCVTMECCSDVLGEESVDSVVHSVPSERSEIKPANLVSEVDTTNSSKVVKYSEEKIWEMIFAMRKIVGYKADIQSNVEEELKALYIFTGVEPPMVFKDPLDLSEVNDKLRLLMAIIGVK